MQLGADRVLYVGQRAGRGFRMLKRNLIGVALPAVVLLVACQSVAGIDEAVEGDRIASGISYVMGTNAETHGPIFWAVSDGGDFNTGDEVCVHEGYRCKAVIAYSNGMIASKIACNVETVAGRIGLVACR